MWQVPLTRLGSKPAAIAGLMVMTIGLSACGEEPAPTPTATPTGEPSPAGRAETGVSEEVLSTGAELYATHCQACHGGRTGEGTTGGAPPHNEAGHTFHHPDAKLKDWILNGKFPGTMPAFKDKLTEEEVDAILAYIRTWWTPDQRESQADISRRYEEALEKQKRSD